jgi:hypothetical protein
MAIRTDTGAMVSDSPTNIRPSAQAPARRRWWQHPWIIGTIFTSLIFPGGAILLLGILSHTVSYGTNVPPASQGYVPPNQITAAAPATSGQNDSGLNLPKEHASDSPNTVVQYMSGANGIYAKAYEQGNTKYLAHYYVSGFSGYDADVQNITSGQVFHNRQITNVVIDQSSIQPGITFMVTYNDHEDTDATSRNTVTYVWNVSTTEWLVTEVS